MADSSNMSVGSAGQPRLYSSEELDGPNASFAAEASPGPAPASKSATSSAEAEGIVERAQVGSLTPRPGETYEQCVNRLRVDKMESYKEAGYLGGCATGAMVFGAAGFKAHPALGVLGAAAGCIGTGIAGAIAGTSSGIAAGEAEGKVSCDGLPGSPEAAKKLPSPPHASSSAPPKPSGATP